MSDLEEAVRLRIEGGYTCAVCKGNLIYTSRDHGVRPLLEWLEAGRDLSGFSASDKVIGKAAAFLFIKAGIAAVQAEVVSEPAREVFREYGIPVRYAASVPGIVNRRGDAPCPMENAVREIAEPEQAFQVIRSQWQRLYPGASASNET